MLRQNNEIIQTIIEKVEKFCTLAEADALLTDNGLKDSDSYKAITDDINDVIREVQSDMADFRLNYINWECPDKESLRYQWTLCSGKWEIPIREMYSEKFIYWIQCIFNSIGVDTNDYEMDIAENGKHWFSIEKEK